MNRIIASAFAIAGPVLLAVVLGACSRERALVCGNDSLYQEARTVGQLQVPDDLTVPDEAENLRIPDPPLAIGRDADAGDGCLEHSPAYITSD